MIYKILNSGGLGVAGRQNELIELALTHKFDGVEIDMNDLVGRHDTLGKEFACQFLQSARIDLGTFDMPMDFGGTDDDFATQSEKLDTIIDLAKTLGALQCVIRIAPQAKEFAFQDNFEKHTKRISEVASKLQDAEIRVGLFLQASKVGKVIGDYKFIQTAEELLTLVKSIGHPNVGVCLDTFEWQVGDGALDQLSDLNLNETVTEVRFADLAPTADKKDLKKGDRLLPGDGENSISVRLAELLREKDYQGAISVATGTTTYSDINRHKVVAKLSYRLAQLVAGEDPTADPNAVAAEEGEEGAEGETAAAEAGEGEATAEKADTAVAADKKDEKEEAATT